MCPQRFTCCTLENVCLHHLACLTQRIMRELSECVCNDDCSCLNQCSPEDRLGSGKPKGKRSVSRTLGAKSYPPAGAAAPRLALSLTFLCPSLWTNPASPSKPPWEKAVTCLWLWLARSKGNSLPCAMTAPKAPSVGP